MRLKRTRQLIPLFLLVLLGAPLFAFAEPELGAVALHQAVLDLGTDLRLMCVAAHPDDEDGATLALYRKKYGLHTVAVFATHGEGGQNEIGPELYNELGVIRTRETMAATRIQGADLRYLDLPEFGFSKSPEETFHVWGHEEALRRIVRAIRAEQPDVIISHHGTQKDHGHHQAVGIILQEAFDAAADPARFPEQLAEGLPAWQVSRLYLRDWNSPPKPESVVIDIGELDAARGLTYAEIAAEALREHRSQGMGFFAEAHLSGRPKVYYTLVREAPQDAVSLTKTPAPEGALCAGLIDRVTRADRKLSQSTADNARILPQILRRLKKLQAACDDSPKAHRACERLSRAAAVALNLRLTVQADDLECVPGQAVSVTATLSGYGAPGTHAFSVALTPKPWFGGNAAASESQTADLGANLAMALTIQVPEPGAYTIPPAEHLFDGHFLEPQWNLAATVDYHGIPLELDAPVRVDVAPPLSADFVAPYYLLRHGVDAAVMLELRLTNHAPGPAQGNLLLSVSPSLKIEQNVIPIQFANPSDQQILPVTATVVPQGAPPGDYHITAMIDGLPRATDAVVRVVDLKLPEHIRVGVVQSYDDTFVKTLERLKVPHQLLTLADFTPERLSAFTTIIVDIRAYLVRPDLKANNKALLAFVERGGTALVMYQKTYEWKDEYAPFPIHLSHNRVTREDAPVQVLVPAHPMFTAPNAILESDWDGWIQERGLYFPDAWDRRYTPLIQCADPGETPPPGSCLVTAYGKGTYLYTALGWYRQLRELHPGALRLFANMLAL